MNKETDESNITKCKNCGNTMGLNKDLEPICQCEVETRICPMCDKEFITKCVCGFTGLGIKIETGELSADERYGRKNG